MTNISVFCNLPDNSTCSVEGDLQGTITDLKNNISTALGLEADYFDVEYLGELPSGGQILCELGFSGDDEIDLKMTSIGFLKSKGMEYEYASNRELFLLFKKHSEDSYAMLILLRTLRADIIVSMIGQITNQDDVVEIVELIAEIDIAKLMSVINEDHIGFIRNQLTLESTKIVCNKIKNHCGGVITNDMKLFCPVALDDSKLLVWLDTISLEDVEDSVCTSSIYVSSIYSNSNPEIVLAVIKNMEIRSHQQFDRSFPLCLNIKTAQFKIVIKTFDLYMEFFERTKTRLDSRSLLKAIFTNRFPSLACEERRYMLDRIPVANTDDPANIFLQLMSEKKIKYLGENVVLYVLSSRKDNYYCSEILYHSSDICLVPVLKVLYSELTRSDFLAVLRIPKGSLRRTFLCRFVASTQTLEIPYSKISFLNDCFDIKDLSFTDERGETPLIIAIRSQSIQSFECVIFLLNQLPPEVRLRLMNRTDRSRLTSIHHVFLTNNVHALRRLVSFGVQIPSSEFVYNMFINSNKKFFSFFNVVVWFLLRENLPFKGPRKRAYCLKRYLTKQEEVSYDSFMKSLAMHCGGVRHK